MPDNAAARAEVLRTRDLIGWGVADPAGATVGTVSDLLIGRNGRVRYLAVKRGMMGASVLIPVDQLEWGEQSLRLTTWLDAEVRRLPAYDGDRPLSPDVVAEMERAHPRFYGPPLPSDTPGEHDGALVPLRQSRDFRLPKTAPNMRGWNVFGEDHERVGVVEDMIVDPEAMKVRYLDVDLADDLFLLREDRHVVIPMEAVELRERGEDVWVHGLTAAQVALLPAYVGGAMDPLVEARVREAFGIEGGNGRDARLDAEPVAPPEEEPAASPAEEQHPEDEGGAVAPGIDAHPAVDLPPAERYPDEVPTDHPREDRPPPLPPRA